MIIFVSAQVIAVSCKCWVHLVELLQLLSFSLHHVMFILHYGAMRLLLIPLGDCNLETVICPIFTCLKKSANGFGDPPLQMHEKK